ncbi:uncharacterized protein LOC134265687 [Saccostrea cucullata]|uniref:uncharacterized protein LOC134265687 n=1 Tax=Saccostrea cuccullata TaxID=36930 RepID=UPI002ED24457
MISDNATTYVASSREIKKLTSSHSLQETLNTNSTRWKFIPKRAPWYGGFWERLIGLTKNCLRKVLGRSFVNLDVLNTIIVEIERILNDRPLTYASAVPLDEDPLTPSHLLYGRKIKSFPYPGSSNEENRTLFDEFNPRNLWKLAKIEELISGQDGLIRSALLKTKNGITSRPITKLYPLELNSGDDNEPSIPTKDRSLRRLHLGNNKILTLFEGAFLGLGKLEELQLHRNRINTLPSRLFAPFNRLIRLELQQNKLKTIQNSTKTFASMTSLKYLNLADNGCSSLPSTLFSNLKSLQKLELSGNKLGKYLLNDFGGNLFLGLEKLEFLDISSNQIHSFPYNIFRDTKSLNFLLLQDNWISGWGVNLFSHSISLSSLDLSNNMITIINEGNMKNLGSLKTVNFTNNPFACTCDLRWFRRWIKNTKTKVINLQKYECNSPAEWKGKLLISFDDTKIECSLVSLSAAVGIAFGVLGGSLVIAFIIYQRRFHMIYQWYRMKRQIFRKHGDYEEIRNEEFDACLIYWETSEDQEWIEKYFMPDFDLGTSDDDYHGAYKIYYHERDTMANFRTLETMMDIMEKSRKIILVVTKHLKSYPPGQFLISEALTLRADTLSDIIIVTVGEISFADVPRLLHTKFKIGDHIEWKENDTNCESAFKVTMKVKLGIPMKNNEFEIISSVQLNGLIPSLSLKVLDAVNLSTLDMSFNEINNIPSEGFKTLTKLNILDLSNCGIRYIHENAFIGLKNLNNLQLSNNYVQSVPKNIPKNLLYLYMSGNQVNVLRNNSFSDLRSLRRLHLGNNKILTLFGEAFLGLNKLEELQLYGNRINTLPSRLFAPFIRLIQLELQQNKLKTIQNSTKTFASMTSLKYLNLADNGCSSLPSTLFSNLKSLQTLHLRGNQLGKYLLNDFGGNLFFGLEKLEFLDISSNQIHSFPSNIFRDTRNLHTLLLQDNWISGWGASLFSNSISLSSLDLSNNMITIINEGNMKNLGSLESVNITNNPFACTCDLRWFRRWIKNTKTNVTNFQKYKCNSPAEWKGKSLNSFDDTKIECSLVSVSVAVGISCGALVVSIISAYIIYQNRFNIMFLRYRMKKWFARKHGGYEEIRNKEYDACLIYSESSDEDKKWIKTNFLPDIDRETEDDDHHGEYKIYYQERDTLGNASTLETMLDVMEKSRKIILVVTKNLKSYPPVHYLITVALWLQGDLIDDIIFVSVGDVSFADVPRLLHTKFRIGDQVQWKQNNINCNRVFKERIKEELGNPLTV